MGPQIRAAAGGSDVEYDASEEQHVKEGSSSFLKKRTKKLSGVLWWWLYHDIIPCICRGTFFWFGFLFIAPAAVADQQFKYETKLVLSGVLSTTAFYGPPNWGETPKIDTRLNAFVLILDKPIDVAGNPEGDLSPSSNSNKRSAAADRFINTDSFINERSVQVDDNSGLLKLERFNGRHVTLQGTLNEKIRMYDRTNVVMTVEKIVQPVELGQ